MSWLAVSCTLSQLHLLTRHHLLLTHRLGSSAFPASDWSMWGSSAFKYKMDRCSLVDSLCAEHSGREPHADPLNGALSRTLCHPSLPCIPLLNHYGLIRGDTHLPCSSCATPHQPSDQQYLRCLTLHLHSVLSVPGQRLGWGVVKKVAEESRWLGHRWNRVRMFSFFFLGWRRLSVQTVAADHRLVLRGTSDRGLPKHGGCFDCGGFVSEASSNCPSNVMWGNLDFLF